jgi:hypothetical protein
MTLKGEQTYRFNGTVSQEFVQLSGINRKYKPVKKFQFYLKRVSLLYGSIVNLHLDPGPSILND